jgi:hypothetical protein
LDGTKYTATTASLATNNYSNSIGAYLYGFPSFAKPFDGNIDEVGIWNRVLSDSEAAILWGGGAGVYGSIANSPFSDANFKAGWHLDEGTGNTSSDFSGHGYTATGANSPTWGTGMSLIQNGILDVAGQDNNAALYNNADINAKGMWDTNAGFFDGVDDYLIVNSTGNLFITNNISIFAWINIRASKATDQEIVLKRNGSGTNYQFFIGSGQTTNGCSSGVNKIAFYNGSTFSCSGTTLSNNQWYYVGVTVQGSNVTYYVNGLSDGTASRALGNYDAPLYIGSADGAGLSYPNGDFSGTIDELKIFNRALSAAEVQADYNRFASARFVDGDIVDATATADWNFIKINSDLNYSFNRQICAAGDINSGCSIDKFADVNLVGLWHFDANSTGGIDLNDSSGQGHNGTNVGATLAAGLWDKNSANFSGSSQYITLGTELFASHSQGTISAWVRPTGASTYMFSSHKAAGTTSNFVALTATSGTNGVCMQADVQGTFNDYCCASGTILQNTWSHVVYSSTGSMYSIYINGVGQSVSCSVGSNSGRWFHDLTGGSHTVDLGREQEFGGTYYYVGQVDDFAVWNRALSASEVQDLYRKGVSRLDLNVYSCSDALCNTKTSNLYIADMNNNYSTSISSLSDSRYLGFDVNFLRATALQDYNASTFWVGGLLKDVNVVYTR